MKTNTFTWNELGNASFFSLAPRRREGWFFECRVIIAPFQAARLNRRLPDFLPLPKGEGRGEGERDDYCSKRNYELQML